MLLLDKIHQGLAYSISKCCQTKDSEILTLFESPRNPAHGDIALPCFIPAKNESISPAILAEKIEAEVLLPPEISHIHRIGPFLNFSLNYSVLAPAILEKTKIDTFTLASSKNETVIVEYSSPNIAKPFHVGHLRATLIGNALDRMYRFAGFQVESINHLGDWGTQFGYVWAGCTIWGAPSEFTVANLVALYKKATSLKDEQEKNPPEESQKNVQTIARSYFLDLEKGEKEALAFWKQCVDVSLEYLKSTYRRLGISFDHYIGESFYSDKLGDIEQELQAGNLLIDSEGAKGVPLDEELGFARILTPDGRSLYLTRDLAAAEYRYKRFNFAKSIYVVGSPQTLHFKQLKAVLKLLKKPYADSLLHLPFGHVLGMKTRGEGKTIELNDFLDEAFNRALDAYNSQVSKRPEGLNENEVADKVARSAILFSTLNRTNIKDVHFNWDEALSFQGDSGPYLLYAYARINGIIHKATEAGISVIPDSLSEEILNKPEAKALLLNILNFEKAFTHALTSNEPLILCSYALDLAKSVSKAYLTLKVVGEDKDTSETNLALFTGAKNQLKRVFSLLGIEALERM
jgi:arginyl-tRNA synthetase